MRLIFLFAFECAFHDFISTRITMYGWVAEQSVSSRVLYFQTKNPNLSKFWRALQCVMLVGIFFVHLVNFMAVWYILWPFGILHQENSGNPGQLHNAGFCSSNVYNI
jgi:hypothetical protein